MHKVQKQTLQEEEEELTSELPDCTFERLEMRQAKLVRDLSWIMERLKYLSERLAT